MSVIELDIEKIEPPSIILRESDEDVSELMESIKSEGLLQPILVRKLNSDKYRIIAGFRRYLACKKLGLKKILARVIETDDVSERIMLLTENIQRRDVNPYKLALAVRELVDKYGLTQEEVARRLGKSKSYISKLLALTRLPDSVFKLGLEGKLDHEVGYYLTKVEDDAQKVYYAERIVEERLPRSTAIEWIKSMEETRKIVEELRKDRKVDITTGEYVEASEEEEAAPPPSPVVERETRIMCIACGEMKPASEIETFNPICRDCLTKCDVCNRTVKRTLFISVCPDCAHKVIELLKQAQQTETKQ